MAKLHYMKQMRQIGVILDILFINARLILKRNSLLQRPQQLIQSQ